MTAARRKRTQRRKPTQSAAVTRWKIDELPDFSELTVSAACHLFYVVHAEWTYRGELETDPKILSALHDRYNGTEESIIQAVTNMRAQSKKDIGWKISLFRQHSHSAACEPDELDWELLFSAQRDAAAREGPTIGQV